MTAPQANLCELDVEALVMPTAAAGDRRDLVPADGVEGFVCAAAHDRGRLTAGDLTKFG